MKPFNKSLNGDIIVLKTLHAKKDKASFRAYMEYVKARYGISKATVYREMKKETPGLYKRPQYIPPERVITPKERSMVQELLEQGYKINDICLVMQRELGGNYSWERIDKIREAMSPINSGQANDKCQMSNEESKAHTPGPPLVHTHGPSPEGNLRAFIENVFQADRISEGKTITVNIAGSEYQLSQGIVKDIARLAANYAEAATQDISELNRTRLLHLVTDKIRLVSLGSHVSVRELKELEELNTTLSAKQEEKQVPLTIKDMVLAAEQ